MIARSLITAASAALIVVGTMSAQQTKSDAARAADRIGPVAPESKGSTRPHAPSSSAASAVPLNLRGGATATGLHGFYDYQSNGGSPEYIAIEPGEWDRIYTVFMNSTDGSSEGTISDSRRAGFAYSSDGGITWVSTISVTEDLKLGYPDIEIGADGAPYIAAHGDLGDGNQVFIYAAPSPTAVQAFLPLGGMPFETATGRDDQGVIWPSFEIDRTTNRGYLAASYFSDTSDGHEASPLQVGMIDLSSGISAAGWGQLPDSLHATASGGRYVLARSASGKLGVAYYHFAFDSTDTEFGVYYSESTDNGATWANPQPVLAGDNFVTTFNFNDDEDTLSASYNIDGTYIGEELHVTFTGNMNNLLRYGNIIHWSPSSGVDVVAMTGQVQGLGAHSLDPTLRQANMGTISYPSITASEDGERVVVVFQATDQREDLENGGYITTASEAGFLYYRIWGVGSTDGGKTWGPPFLIQDFGGGGADSASLEYPAVSPVSRMVNGDLELNVVFQGRRFPGQFAFTNGTQFPGEVEDVHQYFQRVSVTPNMFSGQVSVPLELAAESMAVRVAPNPATSRAIISYNAKRTGDVTISVIDNLGRRVATLADGIRREPGLHSQAIELDGIVPGVYRVVLSQGGIQSTSPLVVR